MVTESVSSLGREARGPKAAGRSELQMADFFPFSVDDTWCRLNLTFLKPWANQCVFLMEMFFLSYASEIMYLLWDFTFFKLVLPETNFCLKPWADNGSTDHFHVSCFMVGDDTSCAIISQKHSLWEGGLVTLPQPWGVSLPQTKSAQTHVHWVGDAIQPSHPLSSSPAFNLSQH